MNKFISKIIGASLAIAMMIGAAVGTTTNGIIRVRAENATKVYSAVGNSSGNYKLQQGENTSDYWTTNAGSRESSGDNRGLAWSKTAATLTYTPNFAVNGLVLKGSSNSAGQTISYTIGTGSSVTVGAMTKNNNKDYTFSNFSCASGSLITISITAGSKSTWVSSITLSYDNGGGSGSSSSSSSSSSSAPVTYTVTYHDTNKTEGNAPSDNKTYEDGASVEVKGNPGSLVRTGYEWFGWSLNQDGTGTAYGPAFEDSYTINGGNVDFYPIWAEVPSLPSYNEELAFDFLGLNVSNNTSYEARSATVESEAESKYESAEWQITVGNNSAQLGTNAKVGNLEKATLGNGDFPAASGLASALNIQTTTQKYSAAICTTPMSSIHEAELIFNDTNGGKITSAWILSSTDGTTWQVESRKVWNIETGTKFCFERNIEERQYAFVAYWNLTYSGGLKGFELKLYGDYTRETIENTKTQTELSYRYVKDGNAYTYTDISMRFGGLVNKTVWGNLDTNEHLIAGVGVMITGYREQLRTPYSVKDHANEAVSSTGEFNIKTQLVDYYVTLNTFEVAENENNYYWNLRYSIASQDDIMDEYTAAAYIKLTSGELVFFKQVEYSVWSLAYDYLTNRNCDEYTAGGSLYHLFNDAGME